MCIFKILSIFRLETIILQVNFCHSFGYSCAPYELTRSSSITVVSQRYDVNLITIPRPQGLASEVANNVRGEGLVTYLGYLGSR